MSPTDEELDRDWQPNGRRPQSTIARSFSQELMDIFKIDNSITDLDEQVDKRKQQVTTQTSELQSLEARIKEMEERLARSTGAKATGPVPPVDRDSKSPRAQRQALNEAYSQQAAAVAAVAAEKTSRPGTAKQTQQAPGHGGAMPPTPTASEGEYELDDDSRHHHRDLPSSSTTTTTTTTITAPPAAGRSPGNFADYVFVSKDGGDRDI